VKCDQYWPKSLDDMLEDNEFELRTEQVDNTTPGLNISTINLYNKTVHQH